jgi:hypothetical protein
MDELWGQDLLEYQKIGQTFTNLVKSLESSRVISIEAGFGHGKTFFRKAWSQQLRASGEIVVEIDAQKSDHTGDPIVTLLAALAEELPREEKKKSQQAVETAKNFGAVVATSVVKIALKSVADDLIEAFSDNALDKLGDFDALDKVVGELGDGMSKAAGQMIAAQMAAERIRKKELPEQLGALHSALTQETDTNRVIVLIDELDRCHPDYAIAVLEAMKLIFGQSGFVFFLMINADYLENLAQHRFGVSRDDEKYLDKFVDIRLRLKPTEANLKAAVVSLTSELPQFAPYGEQDTFQIGSAAELAGTLALHTKLSLRKIKRVLSKVDLAIRCYPDQPLDVPLLIFLAFQQTTATAISSDFLPRSQFSQEKCAEFVAAIKAADMGDRDGYNQTVRNVITFVRENGPELTQLPRDRYGFPDERDYDEWSKVIHFLGKHYLQTHQDVLDAIAEIVAQ